MELKNKLCNQPDLVSNNNVKCEAIKSLNLESELRFFFVFCFFN